MWCLQIQRFCILIQNILTIIENLPKMRIHWISFDFIMWFDLESENSLKNLVGFIFLWVNSLPCSVPLGLTLRMHHQGSSDLSSSWVWLMRNQSEEQKGWVISSPMSPRPLLSGSRLILPLKLHLLQNLLQLQLSPGSYCFLPYSFNPDIPPANNLCSLQRYGGSGGERERSEA